MIVVNYWREKELDHYQSEYWCHIVGVINDGFEITMDAPLIQEAIENDPEFNPTEETLYEIYLERATIASDPVPEPAFAIVKVIEKVQNHETGEWKSPSIRL